ncbi:TagA domain-containing protein [Pseudomonas syringae group genomosp. 3]|nr:TagA domain-containing protein [Pseudomonas syringae group genomosp. 3]
MDRVFLRVSSLALSINCALVCSVLQADEVAGPLAQNANASEAWRNDLDGPFSGQVDFAQTHAISAQRKVVDPLLVPDREALVVFTPPPLMEYRAVSMVVRYRGVTTVIPMAPPHWMPESAVYDQSNTFSGKPIVGTYPKFSAGAFTATIPYNQFSADTSLSFYSADTLDKVGTLAKSKMIFLNSESDGLVLMNIKGCIFKSESTCKTTLDQYDIEKNPQLANIAAREIFSELPIRQLVFGMGQSYWPYIIARGPDGKPHRYSTSDSDYLEWAAFGDKTLPAKVGMGNYWRAASDLGDKQPGKFVAISGQLLDVPDDIPVLPPGVGASCGGNSCNYPSAPMGFWHELGHGLGLPHNTPPRYEKWAYRSYDLKFLPNYHPDPGRYGLGVDYLGLHYFGHVVGSLAEPAWPGSTASAPWVDEFEALRSKNASATADWRHYIAPYTHQQMLRVQQRFGSFPAGLQYAELLDDHRRPPGSAQVQGLESQAVPEQLMDPGIDEASHDIGTQLKLTQPGQVPLLKGVPVQTLVITLASADYNSQKLSQIYPPIISNYGNVFAPTARYSSSRDVPLPDDVTAATDGELSATPVQPSPVPDAPHTNAFTSARIQSAPTGLCLSLLTNNTPGFERCSTTSFQQRWTAGEGERFNLVNSGTGKCIDGDLAMVNCTQNSIHLWRYREDITGSKTVLRLQNVHNGKFITARDGSTVSVEGIGGKEQEFYAVPGAAAPGNYVLRVQYANGSIDSWSLYSGTVDSGDVVSAAVNVSSARKPVFAELLSNNVSVDKRMLDDQPELPPAIVVGAEAGYPVITPQYLRSRLTGQCLSRAATGLTQEPCNVGDARQQWGMSSVLNGSGQELILTGPNTASCLGKTLTLSVCDINTPQFQWRVRPDIAQPGAIELQGGEDGKFITAERSGSVMMQGVTYGAEQNFDRLGPDTIAPLIKIHSIGQKCLMRFGDGVVTQPCVNDINQQWRTGELKDYDARGSHFNLVTPDGSRCLVDGLKMRDCQVGLNTHRWTRRADFPGGAWSQVQSLATGTFITASPNNPTVTQAGLDYEPTQKFTFGPVALSRTAAEEQTPAGSAPR